MGAGEQILSAIARLEAKVDRLLAQLAASNVAVADDADLDSQYGNPEVRSNPKGWDGPDMKGRKMSDCPSEFLLLLASLLDWQAGKDEEQNKVTSSGKPTAPYKRKDASRARGWAKRNEGKYLSTTRPLSSDNDDAELPL